MPLHIVAVDGYGAGVIAGEHNRRLNAEVVPVAATFEQAQPGVVPAPDWGGATSDSVFEPVFELEEVRVPEAAVPFRSADPFMSGNAFDVDDILAGGTLSEL